MKRVALFLSVFVVLPIGLSAQREIKPTAGYYGPYGTSIGLTAGVEYTFAQNEVTISREWIQYKSIQHLYIMRPEITYSFQPGVQWDYGFAFSGDYVRYRSGKKIHPSTGLSFYFWYANTKRVGGTVDLGSGKIKPRRENLTGSLAMGNIGFRIGDYNQRSYYFRLLGGYKMMHLTEGSTFFGFATGVVFGTKGGGNE